MLPSHWMETEIAGNKRTILLYFRLATGMCHRLNVFSCVECVFHDVTFDSIGMWHFHTSDQREQQCYKFDVATVIYLLLWNAVTSCQHISQCNIWMLHYHTWKCADNLLQLSKNCLFPLMVCIKIQREITALHNRHTIIINIDCGFELRCC